MQNETRNTGLDVLRALAVILVLARHSNLNFWLTQFGWLGVDLFFVLSGFLVSGLIFSEYKKTGTVRMGRFLLRRALKIVPPFYCFVLLTLSVEACLGSGFVMDTSLLSECFFLQSYIFGRWMHTWSIGLEVHFYLLLAFSAFVSLKIPRKIHPKWTITGFIFLLILCFLLRLDYSLPHRHEDFFPFFATHLRFDGIICGVFLAYLYHFTGFTAKMLQKRALVLVIALLLVAPAFYFQGGSFFMNTIGLSFTNIGFALVVLLALDLEKYEHHSPLNVLKIPVQIAAFIGLHSYSIYLWHLNAKKLLYHFLHFNEKIMTVLYVLFAIGLGICMSYLIEQTALKLRDRLFRQKENPLSD